MAVKQPKPGAAQPKPETPAAELDLLRAKTYNIPDAEKDALRVRLLAMIVESLVDRSALRLQEIARFIDIAEHDRGCTTPAEEFITRLVSHYHDFGLTPDYALDALEGEDGFRRGFGEAMETTQRFLATYPDALALYERGRALVDQPAA